MQYSELVFQKYAKLYLHCIVQWSDKSIFIIVVYVKKASKADSVGD